MNTNPEVADSSDILMQQLINPFCASR